jgi:hypothetical protein
LSAIGAFAGWKPNVPNFSKKLSRKDAKSQRVRKERPNFNVSVLKSGVHPIVLGFEKNVFVFLCVSASLRALFFGSFAISKKLGRLG